MVFRRMSITKFFNDFTEEVPGGQGREWHRNRTFSIERNYRKTRRYDHGNLRQKEKRKHICDSITICWLNFK